MKLNKDTLEKLASNSFYQEFKIDFLYHTNYLEGSNFSKENLKKLFNEKIVDGTYYYDDVIRSNNLLNVFEMIISDCNKELTKEMLFSWQKELIKGTSIENEDYFIKYENVNIDELVNNLLINYSKIENPSFKDIIKFHSYFEIIHPFKNNNGMISRFIILKQCIENDVDIISIDDKYIKEYKTALNKLKNENDVSLLMNVFEECQNNFDLKFGKYKEIIEQTKKEIVNELKEDLLNDLGF